MGIATPSTEFVDVSRLLLPAVDLCLPPQQMRLLIRHHLLTHGLGEVHWLLLALALERVEMRFRADTVAFGGVALWTIGRSTKLSYVGR